MNDSSAGAGIALTAGVLVTGKTGSGKTSTAKRLIEDLCGYTLDGRWLDMAPRICILDPIKSDWWGITLAVDGKRPALPFVILGGPHGHVPLSDTAGTAIGELVASGQLPMCILDMAFFKMGGLQRFYCDFAEALFRKNRGPLHLVLEEAHEFAPKERTGASGENMAVYWSKKLATAGRSKGLRLMLATQATQSLHNSLMGSCETLLAHRMTLPAHIEPVTEWLKAHLSKDGVEKIRADMPKLSNGQAYIVHEGYVERRQFKMMQTFDNTKTPDGTEIDAAPPPVDRKQLLEIVGEAVKEAAENDVPTLKARIKELEARPEGKKEWAYNQGELDAAYARGLVDGKADALRAAQAVLFDLRDRLKIEINNLFGPGAEGAPAPQGKTVVSSPPARSVPARADVPTADTLRNPREVKARAKGDIGAGAKRLIEAVQKFYVDGAPGFEWSQLKILAGLRAGGYFNTAKTEAIASGLLEVDNGLVKPLFPLVDAKRPRRADLREIWGNKLGDLGGQIFFHVLESKVTTSRELQEALDKKPGGYWNTHFAAVRDAGLIESRSGKVFLSDFVESLR